MNNGDKNKSVAFIILFSVKSMDFRLHFNIDVEYTILLCIA